MESTADNIITLPLPTSDVLPDCPDAIEPTASNAEVHAESPSDATVDALRKQIVLLTHHYVEDACRFQRRLQSVRSVCQAEKAAHRDTASALTDARIRLKELEATLAQTAMLLEEERAEAERMSQIAHTPWWAVGRRRWALKMLARQTRP